MALFSAMGAAVGALLFGVPDGARTLVAVLGAVTGPLACAIERGRARPFTVQGALLVAGVAAAAHVAATLALGRADPARLAAGAAATVALGAWLARFGARLDRGEAGWREEARKGPADGASPLADAIAARGLPRPLALAALPLDLPPRAAILLAIRLYQLTFSRLMPPACRFEPTCSRYGFEAVWRHGAVRGSLLTGLRLLRCSPMCPGGLDPVPPHAAGCPTHAVSSPVVEAPR